MHNLPMLKKGTLEETITFRVEPEMKREFESLRSAGINAPEMLRGFIRRELRKLKRRHLKAS